MDKVCEIKELNGDFKQYSLPIDSIVLDLKKKISSEYECSKKHIRIIYKAEKLHNKDKIIFDDIMLFMILNKDKKKLNFEDDNKTLQDIPDLKISKDAVAKMNDKINDINIHYITLKLLDIFEKHIGDLLTKLIDMNDENKDFMQANENKSTGNVIFDIVKKDYKKVLNLIKKEKYDIKVLTKEEIQNVSNIIHEMNLDLKNFIDMYHICNKDIARTIDLLTK